MLGWMVRMSGQCWSRFMYSAGAVFIVQTNADKRCAIIYIFSYARKRCIPGFIFLYTGIYYPSPGLICYGRSRKDCRSLIQSCSAIEQTKQTKLAVSSFQNDYRIHPQPLRKKYALQWTKSTKDCLWQALLILKYPATWKETVATHIMSTVRNAAP